MAMYSKIINPIEAFQVPPEGETCSVEMQAFLENSIHDVDNLGDGSIEIYQGNEEEIARPGDWIYKERGFLHTMRKSYFENNYKLHVRKD